MMRSLPRIQEKLTSLEAQTTELGKEFSHVYQQHLDFLAATVNQQLVFAVHQICTQIYPEIFLALRLSQRQKFQEKLRQMIREFYPKLLSSLTAKGIVLNQTALVLESITQDTMAASLAEPEIDSSAIQESLVSPSSAPYFAINNPEDLKHWCRELEREIHRHLTNISHETNLLLQKVELLSPKLPPQILEMALQGEESGMNLGQGGMPNILSIVIETRKGEVPVEKPELEEEDQANGENDEDEVPPNSQILKIAAIHLRLPELEFADAHLSLTRKQLRNLEEQLNKLRKQYRQFKRESLRSEAEMAWRSTWSDH